MTEKHCPTCGQEQLVVQPECLDGHAECPEWICVECETVLFGGWPAVDAEPTSAGSSAA